MNVYFKVKTSSSSSAQNEKPPISREPEWKKDFNETSVDANGTVWTISRSVPILDYVETTRV